MAFVVVDDMFLAMPRTARAIEIGNRTGSFLECDIADPVEQMVWRGAPPGDLRPRLACRIRGTEAGSDAN